MEVENRPLSKHRELIFMAQKRTSKKSTHVKKPFIPPFTQLHIIFKHGAKYLFQNIWGSEK